MNILMNVMRSNGKWATHFFHDNPLWPKYVKKNAALWEDFFHDQSTTRIQFWHHIWFQTFPNIIFSSQWYRQTDTGQTINNSKGREFLDSFNHMFWYNILLCQCGQSFTHQNGKSTCIWQVLFLDPDTHSQEKAYSRINGGIFHPWSEIWIGKLTF